MTRVNPKTLPPSEVLHRLFYYSDGKLIRKVTVNGRAKAGQVVQGRVKGYVRVSIDRQHYLVHRIIYAMFYGKVPEHLEIDHINGVKDDNRVENLRLVTGQENSFNFTNALGYSFCKQKNKFRAFIKKDGRTKTLGAYDSPSDARRAYEDAKSEYHVISDH